MPLTRADRIKVEEIKKEIVDLEMLLRRGIEHGRLDTDSFLDYTLIVRDLRVRLATAERQKAMKKRVKSAKKEKK